MKFNAHLNSPLSFFVKKKSKYISFILAISFLNMTVSCKYYKVKNVDTTKKTIAEHVKTFNELEKYIVIHSNGHSWHLNNLEVNEEEKFIAGTVQQLPEIHQSSSPRTKNKTYRYKPKNEEPLNEAHFDLNSSIFPERNESITIPFSDIKSVSVNNKNSGRSILNASATAVGIVVVVAVGAAALTSCPFIYTSDGERYYFSGELYPGCITENMQRDDFMLLPDFKSVNNEYVLKITNELQEIQHTDLAELIVVNHSKEVEVLIDNEGNTHTFSSIESPKKAMIDNTIDGLEKVLEKDDLFFGFDSDITTKNDTRKIVLDFDKSANEETAKLFLTAKNSMWLDYLFGKFNEQFGEYYNTFQKDLQEDSGEKSSLWASEQNIPMNIYVNTKKGWELVEVLNTVGPLATRDIAIPIDIKNVEGTKLQVKIETGYRFWDIDYVGIDFSKNEKVQASSITASSAIDENGLNVTDLISIADKKYLNQPDIGNEVVVTYKSDVFDSNLSQTVFLKNRGYYTYKRDYEGKPDFSILKSFREAGAFTNFSVQQYYHLKTAGDNEAILVEN